MPTEKSTKKNAPNNAGLSYFKWKLDTVMVLLEECLSQEAWTFKYGETTRNWADVATVLKNIPNKEETFQRLRGPHCKAEWERNLKHYENGESLAPFKSGSNEEHGKWHNIMWDIHTRIQDANMPVESGIIAVNVDQLDEPTEVGGFPPETPAVLEKDLKVAGELLRATVYTKFQRQRQRKRKVEEQMFSPGEGESEDSPNSKLTCMDKLAMALTKKLEQDTRPQQSLPNTQPTFMHNVSAFGDSIGNILALVGLKDLQLLQQYKNLLVQNGFESPDLMLPLNAAMLVDMGFRLGHALKLQQVLSTVDPNN